MGGKGEATVEAFHNYEEENHDYEMYEGESEEEAESFMLL